MRALLLGIVAFTLLAGAAVASDDEDDDERDGGKKTACDKHHVPKARARDSGPEVSADLKAFLEQFVPTVDLTAASAQNAAAGCTVNGEGSVSCVSSGSSA